MPFSEKTQWCAFATSAAVLLAAQAFADEPPPAAVDFSAPSAHESFARFAQDWMDTIRRAAEQEREKPTLRSGPNSPVASYREYASDHQVELRPTGNARAPYVGVLRYQELVYACRDASTADCVVSSNLPVTEIFRFQDGRWIY